MNKYVYIYIYYLLLSFTRKNQQVHGSAKDMPWFAWILTSISKNPPFVQNKIVSKTCHLPDLHPWKLTWNLTNHPIEKENHLNHPPPWGRVPAVHFPGCICFKCPFSKFATLTNLSSPIFLPKQGPKAEGPVCRGRPPGFLHRFFGFVFRYVPLMKIFEMENAEIVHVHTAFINPHNNPIGFMNLW